MRTLRARLVISHLIPLFIILPVIGLLLTYLLETQVFVAGISNELTRQAVLVADLATSSSEMWQNPDQAREFVTRISPRLTAKLMLLDPTGRLIISSDPQDAQLIGQAYDMPDLQRLMAAEPPVEVRYKSSQISDVIVPAVTKSGQLIGFVRLTNPLADVYARSQTVERVILYVLGGGLLVGVLFGWFLARDLERPLLRTSQAVIHLANGEAPLAPLPEEGTKEIRLLIHAFNMLQERLKSTEDSRQRLLASMVHELGRPLGALLSGVQALRSGADEQPELRRELLAGMEAEVIVLKQQLDDLAHLRERSLLPEELHYQPVDVAAWLPVVLSTWEQAAREKQIDWQVLLPAGLPTVSMDARRIAQALGNLVSNAVHYTPAGGSVQISAEADDNQLRLHVQDTGPGISPQEQPLIFQSFYRGQAAKRFSDGMGLGLTIARDLVQAHGGELRLESAVGHGSHFTICLPIAAP